MDGFQRFNREKLDSLRARYRGDDLFRTWTRALCIIEEKFDELNAVEIWNETEEIRLKLLEIKEHRSNEVEFLFGKLKERHSVWINYANKRVIRKKEDANRTAIIILTVLFSQFADSAPDEEDDAYERNPNKGLCNALAYKLMKPEHREFTTKLLNVFKRWRYDFEGNKIVLPITDYMNIKSPMELMDEEARHEIESIVNEIVENTKGIKRLLNIDWDLYRDIWKQICSMNDILPMINEKRPRSQNNEWGKNLTFVANVIGILREINIGDKKVINDSVQNISDSLGTNLRTYISNHKDFNSTNTALTKEQHQKIENIIVSMINKIDNN